MDGEKGFQHGPTVFTIKVFRKALVEMIIINELPFKCVEGYRFRRCLTTLQPKLRPRDIPFCQTVDKDMICIIVLRERN